MHFRRSPRRSNASGFTMLEAVVAIFITLIVMGSVFGLLASGTRSSNVEFERADLQAQTRHALDQISRDVMLAGYGLPPEFPSFGTGSASSASDRLPAPGSGPIEIVGMASEGAYADPLEVVRFDGQTALLGEVAPTLPVGQPVVVYDDLPVGGSWVVGLVSEVHSGPTHQVDLVTGAGMSVTTPYGTVSLPTDLERYNRTQNGPPESGYLTPVDVISYELEGSDSDSIPTLVRQLNWGDRLHVAHVETMEIRYFVGGTLVGPVIDAGPGTGMRIQTLDGTNNSNGNGPPDVAVIKDPPRDLREIELPIPPTPQPDPSYPLVGNNVVRAVRISLTGRSRQANLVGSTVEPGEPPDTDGFVRQTYSTRVATRNLLSRAELRVLQLAAAQDEPPPRARTR